MGSDIVGEDSFEQAGTSVELSSDGSVVAIGSPFSSGNGNFSGRTRVYRLDDGG